MNINKLKKEKQIAYKFDTKNIKALFIFFIFVEFLSHTIVLRCPNLTFVCEKRMS